MNTFKAWWKLAKPHEKRKLAEDMDTSYNYLSNIANGIDVPGKHFKRSLIEETGIKSIV